jgi:inorganic phosphate transporter, PiT family
VLLTMPATFLGLLALAAVLAPANGANDVGKPVATLAGARVTSYRHALLWGTVTMVVGALLALPLAGALTKTFSSGFLHGGGAVEAAAAGATAVIWVAWATRLGAPVSTTHAIAGGLVGAGLGSGGAAMVAWSALWPKVFLPLLVSPLVAAGAAWLLFPPVRRSIARWRGPCLCIGVLESQPATVSFAGRAAAGPLVPMAVVAGVSRSGEACPPGRGLAVTFGGDLLHWASAGATSLARGLNDAPKIAALGLPLLLATGAQPVRRATVFAVVAVAMSLGALARGRKIARVLGENVNRLDAEEGVTANLTSAVLILVASRFGMPVSTTHVTTGAIAGVGLSKGTGGISWRVLREIVVAWVITLPVCVLIGAGVVRALAWGLR